MPIPKRKLLILSSMAMVLCCFYAWESFILAALARKPVPMADGALILGLAMVITFGHHQRGWRRINIISLHAALFLLTTFNLVHRYFEFEGPVWRTGGRSGWVDAFISLDQGLEKWLILFLILACVGTLWLAGRRLVTKPTNRATISNRFDTGLGLLLLLFIVKLVIAIKGGGLPLTHSAMREFGLYALIGFLSMGIVRIDQTTPTGEASYIQGAGVVLSFISLALFLGGGLFFLFMPELEAVAETSANLIRTAAAPLGPVMIAILRFVLVGGCKGRLGEPPVSDGQALLPEQVSGGGLLEVVVGYLMGGLLVVICIGLMGGALYWLARWLYTRSADQKGKPGVWELLLSGIRAGMQTIRRFLGLVQRKIQARSDPLGLAATNYRRLLRWGRLSRLRHLVTETPREYGVRLSKRFPEIETEIGSIIQLHDDAYYGGILPSAERISHTKRAWRRMRHPLIWPARIKSFCFASR